MAGDIGSTRKGVRFFWLRNVAHIHVADLRAPHSHWLQQRVFKVRRPDGEQLVLRCISADGTPPATLAALCRFGELAAVRLATGRWLDQNDRLLPFLLAEAYESLPSLGTVTEADRKQREREE